jgi:uncharacterized protein YndB with AHSA1/START domain
MDADVDTLAPLVVNVVVPCAAAAAFRYFTEDIGHWWPLATHSVGRAAAASCAFEPRIGGRLVERTVDGAEHPWGTVTAWDPPRHLAFTWHPGRAAHTAQTVDVRFTPIPDGTSVTLTHGSWAALGARASAMRDEYGSGWRSVLRERFTDYARRAPASRA